MAADASGNIWATGGLYTDGLCEVPAFIGIGILESASCHAGVNSGGSLHSYNPQGIALDGAGTVWIASQGGGFFPCCCSEYNCICSQHRREPWLVCFLVSGLLVRYAWRWMVSGNIWVLLANNTVTEYVGLGTPVVAPLALGVQQKELGAKP